MGKVKISVHNWIYLQFICCVVKLLCEYVTGIYLIILKLKGNYLDFILLHFTSKKPKQAFATKFTTRENNIRFTIFRYIWVLL